MANITIKPFSNALKQVVEDLPTGNFGTATEASRIEELARQQRAIDQGYTIDAYKGMYPYDWRTTPSKDWKGNILPGEENKIPQEITNINARETNSEALGAGFFSNDVKVANRFAEAFKGGALYPVKLKFQNPKIIDAEGKYAADFQFGKGKGKLELPKDSSYDGIILKNTKDEGDVYIPKNSNQIRSRFAQFDPANEGKSGLLLSKTPTLIPVDYQPDFGDFYEATGADKPTFQPKTKLLAETLFNAAPTIFKPAIAMASALPKAIEAFKEGFNKSGADGLKSYAEALENQYVPEGAVKFDDSGQYYDKDGNKLKTQYRPNILPWTRGEGGIPEFAMPAMADVWNTLGGPGGIAKEVVLGAGPSLRPALKYMDKIYKAKPGEQHLDAIPKELQDIFQKQALSGEDISNFNFGFINHKGQFLQREDALKYAIDNGILDPQDAKYGTLVTTMLNKSGGEGKLTSQVAQSLRERYRRSLQTTPDGNEFQYIAPENVNRIKLTPERIEAAKEHIKKISRLEGITGDDYRGLGDYSKEHVSEAVKFAEEAIKRGEKIKIKYPDGPNGSIYVKVGNKGTIRFSDHSLAKEGGKEVGGYSKELGRRHGLPTLDISKGRYSDLNTKPAYEWLDKNMGKKLYSDTGSEGKIASTFFSALEDAVGKVNQNKASGDQWLGTLSNQKGVKGEEIEWTGLKDFLAGKKNVTKADIQNYLKENNVNVSDVWKGQNEIEGKNYNEWINEMMRNEEAALAAPNEKAAEKYWDLFDIAQTKVDRLNKDKVKPTKYHNYQLPGGPLSRDTEILTNKSWKRIDEIEIGDVIMTRKDEGGILEWQPVLAAPKVYAENLYHFFSQSVDMRVTENHQMVVKKRRRNKKGIIRTTARELWKMHEMVIPLTGVWTGKGSEKILNYNANDVAEFIGWYLAEGSYKQKNGIKNTIQIAQCRNFNPEKCDRLEALFNRLGFNWKYYGDAYGVGIKSMNKDLVNLLHSQPKSDGKYIPEFFFNESKSVIQSLLDGLILGDGCTIKNQPKRFDKIMYFTKSKRLAGDVQALILMIGKRASVRQRPSGLYCVGINQKEWSSVDDAKYEIAPYNDFAYCVTVENHSIYVRRNGVAAFTGNTNYRELLLTLPDKNKITPETLKKKYGSDWADLATEEELLNNNYQAYRSSHWNEPNILAHMRMNDRTIDGKKSLHLEEIQSDWHQQGREKGYKGSNKEQIKKFEEMAKEFKAENNQSGLDEALNQIRILQENEFGGVPDAPFKKTWHELALKRAIREAAENGYERLSWTPGEAQAARYDLSKQVDKIKVEGVSEAEGVHFVDIYPKKGEAINLEVENGIVREGEYSGKKLSDIVGKEMSDKILGVDNGFKEFSGDGLKIGSEGMKGFYDQIIPKSIEKIAKEFGVKVQKSEVINPKEYEAWKELNRNQTNEVGDKSLTHNQVYYIDIPPAMRKSVMEKGQPLFSGVNLIPVSYEPDFGDK